jgi:hypothetical protein
MTTGSKIIHRLANLVILLLFLTLITACKPSHELPQPVETPLATVEPRPAATRDPCLIELCADDIIATLDPDTGSTTVFFGGPVPQDWRNFAVDNALDFEENNQGWKLVLPPDMEIELTPSRATILVPHCMIPLPGNPEYCYFQLSALPWSTQIIYGMDESLGIELPPGPMPEDWVELADRFNLLITGEEETGLGLYMPLGTELDDDASQANLHIPGCSSREGYLPADYDIGEAGDQAQAACSVKLSQPTNGILIKKGGFDNSTISIPPLAAMPADWGIFFQKYGVPSTLSDSGYTVYTLPEGLQVHCFEEFCLLDTQTCIKLQPAAVQGPHISKHILNTGKLPQETVINTDIAGGLWIDLPSGVVLEAWRELAEVEERLRVDDLPDGGGRVYFPLHSTLEYLPDQTINILLAEGLPPTLVELTGWRAIDNCNLQLGPLPPDSQMTNSAFGQLMIDIPAGFIADVWTTQAAEEERISMSREGEEENVRVIFTFPKATSVEDGPDGSKFLTYFDCQE